MSPALARWLACEYHLKEARAERAAKSAARLMMVQDDIWVTWLTDAEHAWLSGDRTGLPPDA